MLNLDKILTIPSQTGRISSMEGLRAYAAFIVFLTHYSALLYLNIKHIKLRDFDIFTADSTQNIFFYWLYSTDYGVDIFFFISGYLITGMILNEKFTYKPFLLRRFIRIYPAFFFALLTYFVYFAISRHEAWVPGLILNLFLLNGISGLDLPAVHGQSWSLFYEFSFYLVFPFLFRLSLKEGALQPVRLTLLFLAAVLPLLVFSDSYMRFLMFLGGVLLRTAPRERIEGAIKSIPELAVIVLYLCGTTAFVFTRNWILFIAIYFLPCFLLVTFTLNKDGFLNKLFSIHIIRGFGNISYSFYLYHYICLVFVMDVLKNFKFPSFWVLSTTYFGLAFLLSVAVATLSFWLVERPYFTYKAYIDGFVARLVNRFRIGARGRPDPG